MHYEQRRLTLRQTGPASLLFLFIVLRHEDKADFVVFDMAQFSIKISYHVPSGTEGAQYI